MPVRVPMMTLLPRRRPAQGAWVRRRRLSFDSRRSTRAARAAVARLTDPQGQEAARRWFDQIDNVKSRARRWPDGTLAAVRGLCTDRAIVWDRLGIHEADGSELRITPRAADRLRDELWAEAARALADACLAAEAREMPVSDVKVPKTGEGH